MAKRRTDLKPGLVSTRREVAEHFGVGDSVVGRWIASGAPRPKAGVYDLAAIQRWHTEHVLPSEQSKARLARARADLAEYKLEKQREQYHNIEECRRFHAAQNELVRAYFAYFPDELARQLAPHADNPRAMSVIINDEAIALLNRIADGKPPRRRRALRKE